MPYDLSVCLSVPRMFGGGAYIPVRDSCDGAVKVFGAVEELLTEHVNTGRATTHVVRNHRHEVLRRAQVYSNAITQSRLHPRCRILMNSTRGANVPESSTALRLKEVCQVAVPIYRKIIVAL